MFNSVVTGVRFQVSDQILFLQIQIGKLIDFGIVNQSSVQWQQIPSASQISSKDIYVLQNRLEQLDHYSSCTFIKEMVTGIQMQYTVMDLITKFHVKIFSNEEVKECQSPFVKMIQMEDVINGRETFKLPKETKPGGTYDGNYMEFNESAPISGVGFLTYMIGEEDNRHRPYLFSLNYGLAMKNHENLIDKLGKSLQTEPGIYTQTKIL